MSTQTNSSRLVVGDSSDAADAGIRTPDKAQAAADQAQEKAQQAAGQARDKMREQLDQRSTQLGEQVHEQASGLRSVSAALRDQGEDRPAQAMDRVAGYAEQAGRYLCDKDADAMLSDAEDFGRQKPAVVAAGAVALGFALSRFLKASSRKRYRARDAQQVPTLPSDVSTTRPAVPTPARQPTPVVGATGTPARPGI